MYWMFNDDYENDMLMLIWVRKWMLDVMPKEKPWDYYGIGSSSWEVCIGYVFLCVFNVDFVLIF